MYHKLLLTVARAAEAFQRLAASTSSAPRFGGYNMRVKRMKSSIIGLTGFCALALASCDDGGVTRTGRLPATPSVASFGTPAPRPSNVFATPPPASIVTPAPAGSAVPDAGASGASKQPPDRYKKTGVPTDLAISGEGYFVLSTKSDPSTAADLLFTRDGHFAFVADKAGSLSLWRLRHATDDFFVVGYWVAGGTGAGAPAETMGADHAELWTVWAGQPNVALGLFVDAERNPQAPGKLGFDFTGRLKVADSAPRGPDGGPTQAFLALAQVADPTKLVPTPGFKGVFKYAPAAGALSLGVAVSGVGRVVGNANLILTSTLEQDGATPAAKPL
jgi:hypothetical protein